jgi:hypothetical protein
VIVLNFPVPHVEPASHFGVFTIRFTFRSRSSARITLCTYRDYSPTSGEYDYIYPDQGT